MLQRDTLMNQIEPSKDSPQQNGIDLIDKQPLSSQLQKQYNHGNTKSNSKGRENNDSDLLNSINYNGFDEAQRILQSENDDILLSVEPSKS